MKKTIFFLIACILFSSSLQAKKMVVGINPWLDFITYENHKAGGKTVEIFKKLANELNYEIEFRYIPWAKSVQMLKDGQIDAMGNMSISDERKQYIEFLEPHFYTQKINFYTMAYDTHLIKKYEDLYKYNIVVGHGYVYYDKFDNDKKIKKIVTAYLNTNMPELIMVRMLLEDRAKIIISSSGVMEYLLKKYNYEALIKPTIYKPKIHDNLYIGISKKSSLIKDIDRLNQAMQKIINKSQ